MKKMIALLITGISLLLGLYYLHHHVSKKITTEKNNVAIQSMTPNCSGCGNANNAGCSDSCSCDTNAQCNSGNCYGGLCQHCGAMLAPCGDDGECCSNVCNGGFCDNNSYLGVIVGAISTAAGGKIISTGKQYVTDKFTKMQTEYAENHGADIEQFRDSIEGDDPSSAQRLAMMEDSRERLGFNNREALERFGRNKTLRERIAKTVNKKTFAKYTKDHPNSKISEALDDGDFKALFEDDPEVFEAMVAFFAEPADDIMLAEVTIEVVGALGE